MANVWNTIRFDILECENSTGPLSTGTTADRTYQRSYNTVRYGAAKFLPVTPGSQQSSQAVRT